MKEEAAKKKADENKPDEPTGVKEEPVKPADPNADPLDAGAAEAAEAKKLKASLAPKKLEEEKPKNLTPWDNIKNTDSMRDLAKT